MFIEQDRTALKAIRIFEIVVTSQISSSFARVQIGDQSFANLIGGKSLVAQRIDTAAIGWR
jgi:hypothetical protein